MPCLPDTYTLCIMVSFAVLSDLHGNFEAARRVFEDIDTRSVDEIYCLGDVVGYGPQPQECCDLLRDRDVKLVQGNHEQGLINIHYLNTFNQPARDALRKTREMITDETYEWLVSHHRSITEHDCRFVHGVPPDSVGDYLWKHLETMGAVFAGYGESVCFVGHTHDLLRFTCADGQPSGELPLEQGDTYLDPALRHLVNTGSVGQPRDGDNRAKYGVFDTRTRILTMHFVKYDIQKTADLIVERGFHRGFADRLW